MKKFVIGSTAAALAILGLFYAVFFKGFYIDFHHDSEIDTYFTVDGKEICREDDNEAFIIKGVDLSGSVAGHYPGEFAADKETYLRWLGEIWEMGANTVRVYTIMDDDFYNAFYEFNSKKETPLYLVQGIRVSEAANYGIEDASGNRFMGQLMTDAKRAVDIIHGRCVVALNNIEGSGVYLKDISEWVIGYQVGDEWSAETVAYTDHNPVLENAYIGEYFVTSKEATNFECILAQVMDVLTKYETDKYRCQRLVSFLCDPTTDFLEYEQQYAQVLSKFCQIDPQHIRPTEKLESGYYVSYKLFRFCDHFMEYLSETQRLELADCINRVNPTSRYDGYLELLRQYHTMPVIAGYQYSTARGILKSDEPALTERQQGENLVQMYEDLISAGWSGGFISAWQDAWEQKSWNTAFASVLPENSLWHDLQTSGQNCGIMAFVPGEDKAVCLVDGDTSEWTKSDWILDSPEGVSLSAKYDAEGIYLLIRGEELLNKRLYIPIDTLQENGSAVYMDETGKSILFSRAADFLLCVDGKENSRLLTHEFSDAARINFMEEVDGRNPFVNTPEEDSSVFYVSRMAVEKPLDMKSRNSLQLQIAAGWVPANILDVYSLEFYDTGRLVHGNANPQSSEYNSLADICFGDNLVEIRLPWLMLNFSNPSAMQIHDDYYDYYGVRSHVITQLWIGVGENGGEISMQPVALKGWDRDVPCHERLKESYYIVQANWRGK